jgi:carbamoyl-phosphate synthase large subunit
MRVLVTALGSISAPFVVSAVQEMGFEVVGVDMYPQAWVAAAAQVRIFAQVPPLAQHEAYEHALLTLCREHAVELVVPLTDIEVDHLSARASHFGSLGIKVATSKADAVRLMRNKQAVHDRFKDSGLAVIPTYRRERYLQDCSAFPCVAKRVDGRSSEGLLVLDDPADLQRPALRDERYVFQPFVDGAVLVVDILKTGTGEPIFIARRELTRTKNGAGIAVQILQDDQSLAHAVAYLASAVDFEGCINVEFLQPASGDPMLMDINPRFSAGVAFSGLAGYNFVRNHVAHFLGQTVDPLGPVKRGAVFTRKYMEVVV